MISINIKDNLHNVLTADYFEWIPCTSFSATPLTKVMRKLKLTWKNSHDDPLNMAKIASIGYEYAGLEGVSIPFDLSLEAEVMGCELKLKDNSAKIESSFELLEDIRVPDDFINSDGFGAVEKTVNLLHEQYDDLNIPVFASITGPFTLLCQIYKDNVQGIVKQLPNNFVEVEEILYELYNATVEEAKLYDELNVDAVTIYEPNATPTILEPKMFRELLCPILEDLSETLQTPSLLHICGDSTEILGAMLSCGFEAVNIDEQVNINEAKQLQAQMKTETRISGNVSTYSTLFEKNQEELIDETEKVLENGVDILTPSCMVSPDTPLENLRTMVKVRDNFCEL